MEQRAARDIDGQAERSNGVYGKSDIEGKTAREAASFKRAAANESTLSEFRSDPFSVPQACAQLPGLLQRLGHKNCCTRFFLQSVPLKTGRLIHANRLMIFIHYLQR
jgi:hypothetical protein